MARKYFSLCVSCIFIVVCTANLAAEIYTVGSGPSYSFNSIQAAIDQAIHGDTISVQPGHYYENIHIGGKNITLTSIDPTSYAIIESTIIDAGGNGTAVTFGGTESANCVLQGFTIRGGTGVYIENWDHGVQLCGGGILGGSKYEQTNATVQNCFIRDNIATFGAGVCFFSGVMDKCIIENNQASNYYSCGGAGLDACTNIYLSNSIIRGNYSPYAGAGFSAVGGEIVNCLITDNHADFAGGGFNHVPYDLIGQTALVSNCTIAGNSASTGGALYNCFITEISQSIIWDNGPMAFGNSSPTITYSCVEGGYEGEGNINIDPQFVFGPVGPYSYSQFPNTGYDYIPVPESTMLNLLGLGFGGIIYRRK